MYQNNYSPQCRWIAADVAEPAPLRREFLHISFTKFRLCLVDVLSRKVDLTSLSALFSLFMVSRYCNFCCWFLWPDSRALSSSSLRMVCRNRGSHIFNSYSSRRTIDNWDRDLKCQLSQRLRTNHMPISKQNHITITTVNSIILIIIVLIMIMIVIISHLTLTILSFSSFMDSISDLIRSFSSKISASTFSTLSGKDESHVMPACRRIGRHAGRRVGT